MHRRLIIVNAFALALSLSAYAFAQEGGTHAQSTTTLPVTATATTERVRFAAPNALAQLRLEVYDEAGQKVFDTEQRGGNVLDWHLQDGGGARLNNGAYLCVVTVKDLSGRMRQKLGLVTVGTESATVQSIAATQLTMQQAQAVGPVEAEAALTVLAAGASAEALQPATIVAHDGRDGQLSRTRGALTFRVGDFFSGIDREQMRLTEAGDLGLGTKKPQAKLDVAGDIRSSGFVRATKGVEFADGTVQTSGLSGRRDKDGQIVPNAAGTGTQGRLAKWTDNGGTLGDSVAIDTGTGLQLTAAPSSAIDTNLLYLNSTNGTTGVLAGSTPSFVANNGPYFAMRGNTYSAISGQRGNFVISAGNVSAPGPLEGVVKFITGNDAVRMLITPTGNVGIGTINPQSLLDVAGDINTSTQFKIGGNRVLSNAGNSNLFAGVGAGQANTVGTRNAFLGFNAGHDNVGDNFGNGSDNAFFGSSAGVSNTGQQNSFFGSGAGAGSTIGNFNSFFGEAAGVTNTTGGFNTFIGSNTGFSSTGLNNTTGNNNTALGFSAKVGLDFIDNATNATAIGANAFANRSNTLVLGSINGLNNATADTLVGIGTTSPTAKLAVSGTGTFNAPRAARFDLYNPNSGGGYSQHVSDVGLWQLATTAGEPRMVVNPSGNVGIGTTAPTAAKLVVNDTSVGTAIDGTTSTNGSGVFGQSTGASGYGVYGDAPGGGYAIYANGNTGQALNSGGLVKAMLLVNPNGTINLCYNSQLTGAGATTPLCGFNIAHQPNSGIYDITFPFQVNSRFFSGTTASTGVENGYPAEIGVRPTAAQTVRVWTLYSGSSPSDIAFYLIVF